MDALIPGLEQLIHENYATAFCWSPDLVSAIVQGLVKNLLTRSAEAPRASLPVNESGRKIVFKCHERLNSPKFKARNA